MIYISSACVKHSKIKDSVEELARQGFKNIELSGGTKYYREYEQDLIELKKRYNLNYLIHNYFPPPEIDFVLNLASLDETVYELTRNHIEKAIATAKKLDSTKYGFHAGYYLNIPASEIGKNIQFRRLFDKSKAFKRFTDSYEFLNEKAGQIKLYIENNVLSYSNAKTFQNENPFMLTDYKNYLELIGRIKFDLLLDVGHLKVSAHTLGLDFAEQFGLLLAESEYIHLSDNDGLHDQNRCFSKSSDILHLLKIHDLRDKTITLEAYEPIAQVKKCFELILDELNI